MNIIDLIPDKKSLLSARDHFGKVLKTKLSLSLKQRKLDEITAALVGAKDFNTALGKLHQRDKSPEGKSDHTESASFVDDEQRLGSKFKQMLTEDNVKSLIDNITAFKNIGGYYTELYVDAVNVDNERHKSVEEILEKEKQNTIKKLKTVLPHLTAVTLAPSSKLVAFLENVANSDCDYRTIGFAGSIILHFRNLPSLQLKKIAMQYDEDWGLANANCNRPIMKNAHPNITAYWQQLLELVHILFLRREFFVDTSAGVYPDQILKSLIDIDGVGSKQYPWSDAKIQFLRTSPMVIAHCMQLVGTVNKINSYKYLVNFQLIFDAYYNAACFSTRGYPDRRCRRERLAPENIAFCWSLVAINQGVQPALAVFIARFMKEVNNFVECKMETDPELLNHPIVRLWMFKSPDFIGAALLTQALENPARTMSTVEQQIAGFRTMINESCGV